MAKGNSNNNNSEKPQKQPGFLQLVLAGLLVFLLGGGLVIGYFNLVGIPGEKDAENQKNEQEKEKPTAILELGTIIVNLADPGGTRYLKVDVVLEYPEDEKLAHELEEKKHEITDLVITTLRSKTVAEIQPLDKVTPLKNEIINAVNRRLTNGKISRLFFTEFIIQ